MAANRKNQIQTRARGLANTGGSIFVASFQSRENWSDQSPSAHLGTGNGAVEGVIDRLEKIGFVKRSRATHDRRIQYIQLTATGRKEFDWMASRHERWLEQYFFNVTLADMRKLQNLLLKTRESVSAFSE